MKPATTMRGPVWMNVTNFTFLFILTFLILGVRADECSMKCNPDVASLGGYKDKLSYSYNYEGTTTIKVNDADNQETGAKISANLIIHNLDSCSNILEIKSIQISGLDGTKYKEPRGIHKQVKFTFQDVAIEPTICAEDDDTQRSLNIKRSILSTLQMNYIGKAKEVDVNGVCLTKFTVDGNKVMKTKDLNSCLKAQYNDMDAKFAMYNSDSAFKAAHILQAELRAEAELSSGFVINNEIREEYLYKPFASGNFSAKASVYTRIDYNNVVEASIKDKCVVPKSIFYDEPKEKGNSILANIEAALVTATKYLEGHVQPKSASFFTELIRVLRVSHKDDIQRIFTEIDTTDKYTNKVLTKKVFLDALFRTGTGPSIQASLELLKNNKITPLQKRLVLSSLTNARHVSIESVKAVAELMEDASLPNEIYLGIGAVTAMYCKKNDCSKDKDIEELSARLITKLDTCKVSNKENEDKAIFILKGLKNMNHVQEKTAITLSKCASDKTVPMRVRVAAVEAFAADPRSDELENTAYTVLGDANEDSELRIKAFLALSNYPSKKLVETARRILNSDKPVYQVCSFIASFIKNIKTSKTLENLQMTELFKDFKFKNEYPLDPRRYSQAYKFHYSNQDLGMTSLLGSNIIYSQNSYLPRSVNLNLTAEVFGKNINLIEVSVRQGNLDRIVEEYFGPRGIFRTSTPQKIYDDMKKSTNGLHEKIQSRLKRGSHKTKRDVQQEIAALAEKLKTDIASYKGNLDIDVFVKLFGSESVFLSLGDDQHFSMESLVDRVFDFVEGGIDGAEKFSYEVRSHMLLLDAQMVYPTSAGMVLRISAEGASTGKLSFGGSVDLRQIFSDVLNSKINVELMPSASVDIITKLEVDAESFSTGVKVVSSLQTSTGIQVTAKLLNNGKGFDINVGFPLEKQEIISASNDIFFFTKSTARKDIDRELKFKTKMITAKPNCGHATFGLEVCTEMSYPQNLEMDPEDYGDLKILLNPQFKYKLYLTKNNFNGYRLHGMSGSEGDKDFWELIFDASGDSELRKVVGRVETVKQGESLTVMASLRLSEVLHAEVSFVNILTKKEKSLALKLSLNDEIYYGKIGLLFVDITPSRIVLKPILDFSGTDMDTIALNGNVNLDMIEKTSKLILDGLSLHIGQEVYTYKGWEKFSDNEVEWDIILLNSNDTASFTGRLFRDNNGGNEASLKFKNTQDPNYNFAYTHNFLIDENSNPQKFEGKMTFIIGPDIDSSDKMFSFTSKSTLSNEDEDAFTSQNKLTYPPMNLDYTVNFDYIEDKKLKIFFDASLITQKMIFNFDFDDEQTKENERYGKLMVLSNGNGIELFISEKDESNITSQYEVYMVLHPGGKYEVSSTIRNKEEGNDEDLYVMVTLKVPNVEDVMFELASVSVNHLTKGSTKIYTKSKTFFDGGFLMTEDPAGDNLEANVNFFIINYVTLKGKAACSQESLTSEFTVEMYKVDKVIQFECNGTQNENNYTGVLMLYTDYKKDKSQFYKIESSNSFDEDFEKYFESSTSFYFDHKEAKLKMQGNNSGDIFDSTIHLELEYLDPNKNAYKAHFNEHRIDDGKVHDAYEIVLQKIDGGTGTPRKLMIQANLTDYNEAFDTGTVTLKTTFEKESGENAAYFLRMMRGNADSRGQLELETALSGSLVSRKWNYYFWTDFEDNQFNVGERYDINYKSNGTYDTDTTYDLKGRYAMDVETEKLYSNSIDMSINLPHGNLRTVVLTSQASYNSSSIYIEEESYNFGSLTKVNVNSDNYVYELNGGGSEEGTFSVKIATELPGRQPFSLDVDSRNILNSTSDKKDLTLNVVMKSYGQKMVYSMTGYSGVSEPAHGEYKCTLTLPNDKEMRNVKAIYKYSMESETKFMNSIDLDVDGKKYYSSVKVDYNKDTTSMIDLKAAYPNSKPMRLYVRNAILPERKYQGHTTLENFGEFNLDLILSTAVKSVDDFYIKGYIDCPKLHLKQVDFTGSSTSPKAGDSKEIQFEAKENGKPLTSGTIKLVGSKTDLGFTAKGEGKITIRGVEKQARLEYVKEETINQDGKDSTVLLHSTIGDTSLTFNYTNSNKIFLLSTAYCESENDCARIRLNSDIKKENKTDAKTSEVYELEFDLKKLGYPTLIDLKSEWVTTTDDLPIYTINLKTINNDIKYQIESVAVKLDDDYKTYISITIPTRVIYLETTTMLINKILSDAYSAEVILYFNKNDPNSKIHYKSSGSLMFATESDISIKSQAYFVYPGAPKELKFGTECTIDIDDLKSHFAANIDIFDKKEKEIVVEAKIIPKSEGDNLHYKYNMNVDGKENNFMYNAYGEFNFVNFNSMKLQCHSKYKVENDEVDNAFLILIGSKSQKFYIKTPAGRLLDMENTIHIDDDISKFKFNSSLELYNTLKYSSQTTITIEDGITIKYNGNLGKPSEDLTQDIVVCFKEDLMEIKSSFMKSKNAYPLFKMSYRMPNEGKSMSSKETNSENMKMFMDAFYANINELKKQADHFHTTDIELYHKVDNRLSKILLKSIPKFDISTYLKKELRVIHEEIKTDEFLALLEIEIDVLLTVTSTLIDNIYAVFMKTLQMKNQIYYGLIEFYDNLQPLLNKSLERAMDVTSSAVEPLVDLVINLMTFVADFVDRHTEHIMQMNSAFTRLVESIEKVIKDARELFSKFVGDVSNAFVFLIPIDEPIQLLSSENLHAALDFIGEILEDFVPEKEWKDLYDVIITSYDQKNIDNSLKMRKKRLDNILTKTQTLVIATIEKYTIELDEDIFSLSSFLEFLGWSISSELESSDKSSYSTVTNIIEIDYDSLPSFVEVLRAVRPIFYPDETLTPYKLKGFITEGKHVFTFDGHYLTTPGNCKFVVAHDAVDGNFTIIMNIKDKKAKSVTLIDKDGYSVKLNDEGKVMVNGKDDNYPVKTSELNVASKSGKFILLKSKYGVTIACEENLHVCEFKVSGFYYGKLRGLLGDGNGEPFDDMRLPNGTVVSSEYDFGTSYGLNQQCASDNPLTEKKPNYYDDDICEELFEEDFDLEFGNYVLDNKIYKKACKRAIHELSSREEVTPTACSIAKTYALACMANFFRVSVPDVCIQCNIDDVLYQGADGEFTTNTLSSQADIVLVIETSKSNQKTFSDLVAPLMSNMLKELKEKEINDVKIYLVGLGSSTYAPTLYETKIENFNMISKISFDDEDRSEQWRFMLHTNDLNVDEYLKTASHKLLSLSNLLGVPDLKLYDLGRSVLLFRPKAMKSIILVQSQKCPTGLLARAKNFFTQISLEEQGILTHLITPLEEFEVPKIRERRNAIGFNNKEVFIDGEKSWARNKSMSSSDIKYGSDECVDLALETKGSVFSSKQFMDPKRQPNVLKLAAHIIVDSMLKNLPELTCSCSGGITGWQSVMKCETD